VHICDNSFVEDTPAKVGRVHCIDMEKQELHIISTLNTLGYIDFNVPYNMNCLEERLSKESGLQCFSRCVFRAIAKYDGGEILMHQVYMCSNLKYPFELQRIERIMACTNVNSGLPSFYRIQLLQQGRSMKGENLWPCIKPRTACHKEQEDDEIKSTSGANICVPPWPPPFTIRGGHGGVAIWKMNLSRG
jgi:hypothetical protein